MKQNFFFALVLALAVLHARATMTVAPVTYQGRLVISNAPANGVFDFYVAPFDASTNGNFMGNATTGYFTNVVVNNGLFTLPVNEIALSPEGTPRWLEISVKPAGSTEPYTMLLPRQQVTFAPQAYTARVLLGGVLDSQLSTNIPRFNLPAQFGDAVTAPTLTVTGVLNAARIQGGSYTSANGENSGVAAGLGNVVSASAGFIGGGTANYIDQFSDSSVIAGGYFNNIADNSPSSGIFSGAFNRMDSMNGYSAIASGLTNFIGAGAKHSFIGGGATNVIEPNGRYSTLGGGLNNTIGGESSVINGGVSNRVYTMNNAAAIGGGFWNGVGPANVQSTIGGGFQNYVGESNSYAVVSGGHENWTIDSLRAATISGGGHNIIGESSDYATIGGGLWNQVGFGASNSVIGGGAHNAIYAPGATVSGGDSNHATNQFATVPGGSENLAGGVASFAAGQRAQAVHDGSFVWADKSSGAFFSSSSNNQFLVRATNGVGINTRTPTATLDVNGTLSVKSNASIAAGLRADNATLTNNLVVRGTLQLGSGTGTTEAPNYPMIMRRVNSFDASSNSVVARTDKYRLIRDGNPGGMWLAWDANPGGGMVAMRWITSNNTSGQSTFLLTSSDPGRIQLIAQADLVQQLEITFGNPYSTSGHLTEVHLNRVGVDYYWVGFVFSTFNQ